MSYFENPDIAGGKTENNKIIPIWRAKEKRKENKVESKESIEDRVEYLLDSLDEVCIRMHNDFKDNDSGSLAVKASIRYLFDEVGIHKLKREIDSIREQAVKEEKYDIQNLFMSLSTGASSLCHHVDRGYFFRVGEDMQYNLVFDIYCSLMVLRGARRYFRAE